MILLFLFALWPLAGGSWTGPANTGCQLEGPNAEGQWCCLKCHAGNRLSSPCSPNPLETCEPCREDTWSDGTGDVCAACAACSTQLYNNTKECVAESDAQCACVSGARCIDPPACRVCAPPLCPGGQENSPSDPLTCVDCGPGTFRPPNSTFIRCRRWTACEGAALGGSALEDVVCAAVAPTNATVPATTVAPPTATTRLVTQNETSAEEPQDELFMEDFSAEEEEEEEEEAADVVAETRRPAANSSSGNETRFHYRVPHVLTMHEVKSQGVVEVITRCSPKPCHCPPCRYRRPPSNAQVYANEYRRQHLSQWESWYQRMKGMTSTEWDAWEKARREEMTHREWLEFAKWLTENMTEREFRGWLMRRTDMSAQERQSWSSHRARYGRFSEKYIEMYRREHVSRWQEWQNRKSSMSGDEWELWILAQKQHMTEQEWQAWTLFDIENMNEAEWNRWQVTQRQRMGGEEWARWSSRYQSAWQSSHTSSSSSYSSSSSSSSSYSSSSSSSFSSSASSYGFRYEASASGSARKARDLEACKQLLKTE